MKQNLRELLEHKPEPPTPAPPINATYKRPDNIELPIGKNNDKLKVTIKQWNVLTEYYGLGFRIHRDLSDYYQMVVMYEGDLALFIYPDGARAYDHLPDLLDVSTLEP